MADAVATVTLALQHLSTDLAAAVATHSRLTHRQERKRLHFLESRIGSLVIHLLIVAEVAQSLEIAHDVLVVQSSAHGALSHSRRSRDHQVWTVVRISRADRHLRLSTGHRGAVLAAIAATVHRDAARRARARMTAQLTRVLLAIEQLPADVVAVHRSRVGAASHLLLRLPTLTWQRNDRRAGVASARMADIRARMNARPTSTASTDLSAAVRHRRIRQVFILTCVRAVDHAMATEAPRQDRGHSLVTTAIGTARVHALHALAIEVTHELRRLACLLGNRLQSDLIEILEDPLLHAVHVEDHVARGTRPDLVILSDDVHADRTVVAFAREVVLQSLAERQIARRIRGVCGESGD